MKKLQHIIYGEKLKDLVLVSLGNRKLNGDIILLQLLIEWSQPKQSQTFLRSAQQLSERQLAQVAVREILTKYEEEIVYNILRLQLSTAASGPERLWNCYPYRYSDINKTRSSVTSLNFKAELFWARSRTIWHPRSLSTYIILGICEGEICWQIE